MTDRAVIHNPRGSQANGHTGADTRYLDGPDGVQPDRLLSRTMAYLRAFLAPLQPGEA